MTTLTLHVIYHFIFCNVESPVELILEGDSEEDLQRRTLTSLT